MYIDTYGGRALRIAVGITALALLLAGGAGAASGINISPQTDINNSFIMHRLDAGIPSHRDIGMPFRNQTGELTSGGLNAEYSYGRIPSLPTVISKEKSAAMISANAGWFINDNETGGDCTSIGTWNAASKTCTLTTDLTGTVEIDSDGITLDGNSHTITGSNTGNGIYLSGRNGVTVKNTNVRNFFLGIYLYSSSNSTLSGNNASNNSYGVYLDSSNHNTLSGNNANSNNDLGINLYSSSNNILMGNIVANNSYIGGIEVGSSSNGNMLSSNLALNNSKGIELWSSNNNILNGNNASDNFYSGIRLGFSGNNTLTNNTMIGNKYNFGFGGYSNSGPGFDNQIDTSNMVNGKPIYYIRGAANEIYDSSTNAGTFYCIDCVNVTIKDLNLNSNIAGIFFGNTTNSRIQNINTSNNLFGIDLFISSNNILSNNTVLNNDDSGIDLFSSSNNTLSGNNASNNIYGIYLFGCSSNILSSNNASNNTNGIYLFGSDNNLIYNNFFNNTNNAVTSITYSNYWNTTKTPGTNIIGGNNLGSNVWANPNGTGFSQICADSDSDGICDSPYILDANNIDYLPLSLKPSAGQPIVDQSFTSPYNMGANINECCAYVAQTFTAGMTGTLTGVNINVLPRSDANSNLHVAVHMVENGLPTWNVLGSTTLNSAGSPLSELITFPQPIPVVAGVQYAIVVSYVNAPPPGAGNFQGIWSGATGDVYKGGEMLAFDGNSWIYGGSGYDVHFQTYVIPIFNTGGPVISIASQTVAPGSSVTAPIMANNITNVEAHTISLTYNPAVVVVDNVGAGALGGITANINNSAGVTQMSAFSVTPQSGNVTLANVVLRAVGTAGQTSPLNLTVTTLRDNNGNPIPASVSNGTFNVSQLTIAANRTNVSIFTSPIIPTPVLFTVMLNGSNASGANVTLSGAATGSGTTAADGTVVLMVSPTRNGTINATATLAGNTATTTLTAKGDVNGDNQVNIVDALFIAQYTVNLRTLSPDTLVFADVNGDGKVDIVDALFIAQATVGISDRPVPKAGN